MNRRHFAYYNPHSTFLPAHRATITHSPSNVGPDYNVTTPHPFRNLKDNKNQKRANETGNHLHTHSLTPRSKQRRKVINFTYQSVTSASLTHQLPCSHPDGPQPTGRLLEPNTPVAPDQELDLGVRFRQRFQVDCLNPVFTKLYSFLQNIRETTHYLPPIIPENQTLLFPSILSLNFISLNRVLILPKQNEKRHAERLQPPHVQNAPTRYGRTLTRSS